MVDFVTQAVPTAVAAIAVVLLLVQSRRLVAAREEAATCRAALQEMEVAYDQAPLGLTVLDRDLRYRRINQLLAALNGLPPEAHVGRSIHEIVPEVSGMLEPIFRSVMETEVPRLDLEFEAMTGGEREILRAFRESVYPVRDHLGNVVGVAVAAEEITEQKRLLDALHASEQRERLRASELESVMQAAPAAIFIAHDTACLNVTANAEALRLRRLNPGDDPSLSSPGPHTVRVYADGVELASQEMPLQLAAASGQEMRGRELELRFDDGAVMHILLNAVPLRGHDGALIGAASSFVDITAQKTAAQELKLQARHKDEFLAVLAHELRNPLAAIQAGVELLKIHGGGNAQLTKTREIMQRQMAHMVRLVDDLLDVARISSGKLELELEATSARDIVNAAVELCRGEIEGRGHRLEIALPPDDVYVQGDRVRLVEVVGNLLHNAAKYTPNGGSIRLAVAGEGGEVVFRVADNGVGIAPDILPRLFAMFAQAEDARAQRKGGLGVGLALASRIVELHGGTISAASDGPGRGSMFTVRLPAADAPVAAPEQPALPMPAASLRILVLDDNADAAHTLGALLEASGHEVRLAFTGGGALEELEHFHADIAILDIGLPDMSGLEVARRIRAGTAQRGLFLVALSGWGSDSDRQQSEAAGFDLHLIKPVTLEAIEQFVLSRQRLAAAVDKVV